MPVNSHIAISATLPMVRYAGVAHPAVANTLHGDMRFRCHEVLSHLIWGGVLERHPKLGVALTEQGSDWVIGALESWDYSYEGSFQRRDVREVVPLMPSEYFRRQCWLGSSLFSRAEVEARHRIGIDQMLLGMDYPHHEGTLAHGTVNYLRATLGAAGVPAPEARRLLGENAVERWKFDTASLRPLADEFGPELELLLTPPDIDFYPRGGCAQAALNGLTPRLGAPAVSSRGRTCESPWSRCHRRMGTCSSRVRWRSRQRSLRRGSPLR